MATSIRSGSWGSSRSSRSSSTKAKGTTRKVAPGYSSVCNQFNQRIQSYKTLCAQMMGPARKTRPSASTLNTLAKWVEKGATIHKVSPAQIKRWTKVNSTFKTTTPVKNALAKKFGKSTIKAVCQDKSGSFLVACGSSKGKPFSFPNN